MSYIDRKRFEKIVTDDGFEISDFSYVDVLETLNNYEVRAMQHKNKEARILKLDKDRYISTRDVKRVVTSDGEVFESYDPEDIKFFNRTNNRSESENGIRKTFINLRRLISNNFTGNLQNELFITLTNKENIRDNKENSRRFDLFMKRLKRKYKDVEFGYIAVVEPQRRGSFHTHLLLKAVNQGRIYIPNEVISQCWEFGFTKTNRLVSSGIAQYFTAYLTDVVVDDDVEVDGEEVIEKEVMNENGELISKKVQKNGRLKYYNPNTKIYRKSRNMIMPEFEEMQYKDIKKELMSEPAHRSVKLYQSEDESFSNIIVHEYYNK